MLGWSKVAAAYACLLYTSDAADERSSVDLGGRRIIKKKTSEERGRRPQDKSIDNQHLEDTNTTLDTENKHKMMTRNAITHTEH